jgi:hypothetical protein
MSPLHYIHVAIRPLRCKQAKMGQGQHGSAYSGRTIWLLAAHAPILIVACLLMTSGVRGVNSSTFRVVKSCTAFAAQELAVSHLTRMRLCDHTCTAKPFPAVLPLFIVLNRPEGLRTYWKGDQIFSQAERFTFSKGTVCRVDTGFCVCS